jgi:pSer/pThr/pTyr-binding forkhead associated (FHA) protein
MDAEFIVVSGPLLGERFPLTGGDIRIGRSPPADIRLPERQAAWEHCTVRMRDGRYQIDDCRTGVGTHVNGLRITQHCLEPGDQIGICDTVLVYREDTAPAAADSQ